MLHRVEKPVYPLFKCSTSIFCMRMPMIQFWIIISLFCLFFRLCGLTSSISSFWYLSWHSVTNTIKNYPTFVSLQNVALIHFQPLTDSPRRPSWSWSLVCVATSIKCKHLITPTTISIHLYYSSSLNRRHWGSPGDSFVPSSDDVLGQK